MKHLLSIILFYTSCLLQAQSTVQPLVKRNNFVHTSGLVAYYFWEEDTNGNVIKSTFDKPFLQNYTVLFDTKEQIPVSISPKELKKSITRLVHDSKTTANVSIDSLEKVSRSKGFSLNRLPVQQLSSIIYKRKNNHWESLKRASVLVFSIKNGETKFQYTSDSVVLIAFNRRIRSTGQYVVYNYLREDNTLDYQRVINYSGEDITELIETNATTQPARILVFANGYRGPDKNKDESDGLVTQRDRYGYWHKIPKEFVKRLQPLVSYYIDGSLSIETSPHKSNLGFLKSYLRTKLSSRKTKAEDHLERLNLAQNSEGFKARKERGKIAGLAFLYAITGSPECSAIKDTIDIVSHSMGYAYSLGFMEAIEGKVIFGNIYILAPESACMEGYDWTRCQEVWQYGSNLGEPNADPLKQQDGVAPQCAVKGLSGLPIERYGRTFIPKDWPKKDFIESHMVYNYHWIFDCIKEGEAGFVRK